MLCDMLAEYERTNAFGELPYPYRHAMSAVKETIADCPRFVLQRDAVRMIHEITVTTPKRFLSAINVCRMPFPKMWVEFDYKDRNDWFLQARDEGRIGASHFHDSSPPKRVGFLLEQMDEAGRIISCVPMWTHEPPFVNICTLAVVLHLEPDHVPGPDAKSETTVRAHFDGIDRRDRWNTWLNDPVEYAAAVDLERRIEEDIPAYQRPLWEAVLRSPNGKALSADLVARARFDLASEWRFVMALMTVLNSRNVVDTSETVSYEKLNKARTKKGQPPLLDHREVRISLTKVLKNRMASRGIGGRDMQAHVVRGHWKLRSSGLFWWSPHVRAGEGEIPKSRTYVVTG